MDLRYAWLKGPQDLTVESRKLSTALGPHDVHAHTIISALKIGQTTATSTAGVVTNIIRI